MSNEALVSVPPERAARIAGVSTRRLIGWDASGLLRPPSKRQLSQRNTVRLYDFSSLIDLRVIVALHDQGRPIRQIRRVLEYIRTRYSYDQPLQQLRFAVVGRQIIFQHPDGTWEGDFKPGQIIIEQVLRLDLIQQQVKDALSQGRSESKIGQVEKRRKVFGSKPVFAGTRVPVSAVQHFIAEGATDERILSAYPDLTKEDIQKARQTLQTA